MDAANILNVILCRGINLLKNLAQKCFAKILVEKFQKPKNLIANVLMRGANMKSLFQMTQL